MRPSLCDLVFEVLTWKEPSNGAGYLSLNGPLLEATVQSILALGGKRTTSILTDAFVDWASILTGSRRAIFFSSSCSETSTWARIASFVVLSKTPSLPSPTLYRPEMDALVVWTRKPSHPSKSPLMLPLLA
ncbi:BZ3500_MvSof-1268-A1-R1_Chr4-2g07149 [Microbotryum saponariae]|uniref:BZ3500_MvSof-1268-A1-R1_Chr4-2g07149 protein n=1 Tax=Microbotryum saponariae TaxID=289078 RepID=A0A2X0LEJ4_9BASI|nr:BZ3500_MvSof-1268-A1-R1_Chr4-2g07149 [Microbotryum saponariae]SDA06814.1 BZ3501_MvSof-1269-A2-R1_Chr4-2g06860 [Microbotryum saponariae]